MPMAPCCLWSVSLWSLSKETWCWPSLPSESDPLARFPPCSPTPQSRAPALTWPLDCDLELPTAGTLSEHLEVSHLFHAHTLGLQAPSRGAAGVGVTGCGLERED